jgi:hypothetical protein
MTATIIYLLIGMLLGFLFGLNSKESPTDGMNRRRIEQENKDLELKLVHYRKTIQELVEDNRRLVKELEQKDV